MQEAAEKAGREIIASEGAPGGGVQEEGQQRDRRWTRTPSARRVLKNTKPTDQGYRQKDYDRIINIK